jgi:arylsulfatase
VVGRRPARHDILPLDWRSVERLSEQLTGRPNLAAGRKTVVLQHAAGRAAGKLGSRSEEQVRSRITAEVNIPADGAEGVIFTQGGITAGWGFYIQDRKLVGMHNYIDSRRFRVVSTEDVPTGKVAVAFDFNYDGGGMSKGGTITLLANGRKIGSGRSRTRRDSSIRSTKDRTSARTAARRSTRPTRRRSSSRARIEKVTVELK